ncbi:hypothetical protein [Pantoea sp. A4]|uniref:hypothetical protein n=1 Tax=Pantoea sp. A4 TaxID=1225184 RepID=UPI000372D5CA|nr:hypothetical protein [Pantoea sp. A4]
MPVFCFFKKGNHINALDVNDLDGSVFLQEWGYKKQPEEVNALNAHSAKALFNQIRNEEKSTHHALSFRNFLALILSLIAISNWLFL